MKKPVDQLKTLLDVPGETPSANDHAKALKEVKRLIKLAVKLTKVFMALAALVIAGFILGGIGIIADYAVTQNPDDVEEIFTAVQAVITSGAIMYICVICKKFCEKILESDTPFIPQVPKSMRKIAAVTAVMLIVSDIVSIVLSLVFGMEVKVYVDGKGWFMVFLLLLLSSIFDYGCKLQKESDETL
ncbi:MAG: DUF2975 domain-containing protein [Ruminococcus sp.]|nr:DUF2975 domain-containing protein [Ruminococcus sp.]MCM1381510.1 DUF2975 domain-containing protein [Muribaculaceae bacterium]MCM1480866.1 DUF2975 domain-containing protein [Muribaculaceae bacterium]